MSKILDWIKKHIWQTVLIGFGLFFLPLILVHIAYRIAAISPWFASIWQAGELITYIAGFEAFLGTLVLGAVTVFQNSKATEINMRLLDIEDKNGVVTRYPSLDICNADFDYIDFRTLADKENLRYCSEETSYNFLEIYNDIKHPRFYYVSFQLNNRSVLSITIDVKKFDFSYDSYSNAPNVNYVKYPESYHRESLFLSPNTGNNIGFIIDPDVLDEYEGYCSGKLSLTVTNNAEEKFEYCVIFAVLIEEESDRSNIVIKRISSQQVN